MMRFRAVSIVAVGVLVLGLSSVALGMKEPVRPMVPPQSAVGGMPLSEPFLMLQAGDTTWIQVHADTTRCPGDPLGGHGGEGTGGPTGAETYCVEGGVGDSCGTTSPWTSACFTYQDVRALPSQTGINYWHVDSYRTDQRDYLGTRALWCGSAAQWGAPPNEADVECGTWINPPGYGNQWNCNVQLALDASFDVAGGCTVYFDPRYDLECKYDYYYIDYLSRGPSPTFLETWVNLAVFNGTSNTTTAICGDTKPNPDTFGNGDARGPGGSLCNWQERTTGMPAFPATIAKGIISHAKFGTLVEAPKFRWRMTSDGAWSDADGRGNTDGAAYLDNVVIHGDNPTGPGNACIYTQDFEGSSVFGALPAGWTLENPPGIINLWHITHNPNPPYESGDSRTTCLLDSSWVWRGRPEQGYATGTAWRNAWYYRILGPKLALQNSGAIVQFDQFMCAPQPPTCDATDTKVRFFDGTYGRWCPWVNMDGYIMVAGCFFWNFDDWDDVTAFYGPSMDSMQFAFELMDNSQPGEPCRGKHGNATDGFTENIIDNVSLGFYDGSASIFSARGIDILHDSFMEEVDQAYNSFFDVYSSDTITKYSSPTRPVLPKANQMVLDVTDKDSLASVEIWGSDDGGATWVSTTMTLDVPADPNNTPIGGEYYGTLAAGDFTPGATDWVVGTEVWYYVKAVDLKDNVGYFPARANPDYPGIQHTAADYFEFTLLPKLSPSYTGPKLLLVDGHGRNLYDWSPCLTVLDDRVPLEDIYEQTLTDAGYCFDKFDISGAGTNQPIHPGLWAFTPYDAVVWFSGPYFSGWLANKESQLAVRDYLNVGGKIVLCADRLAYTMGALGEDSLGGEFLAGVMGTTYQEEMESGFTKPFVYMEAPATISIFDGPPTPIPLDTVVIYRECPYLKDMSYVITNTSPPAGYKAQQLLSVLNPGAAASDGAVYVEYQPEGGQGQAVYINFDLCATVNHSAAQCNGVTPAPAPDFSPGYYYGRVDLMKAILFNLFGLPGGSGAGVVEPPKVVYQWALNQNTPNPLASGTEIRFEVARTSDVSIKVYNAMGQLVKVLKDSRMEPGPAVVSWDGRNQAGERVSSGVYFYSMEADKYKATKKMLVVK